MMIRNIKFIMCSYVLLLLGLLLHSTLAQPFLQDGLNLKNSEADRDSDSDSDDDDFLGSEAKSDYELDWGSWNPVFELKSNNAGDTDSDDAANCEEVFHMGLRKMVSAASRGDERAMAEASAKLEAAAASGGQPNAQSVMGFLYGMGIMRERNKAKAYLHHYFAAEGGNLQSKMALAYDHYSQDMHDKAIELYAELAEIVINNFPISEYLCVTEPVQIHCKGEENKEVLRKFREEDEGFQIFKYEAQKENAEAMYKIGTFYYFGLRGLRRDHSQALSWFLRAAEKGEPRSMGLLGELYAGGSGVERNYTKAMEWLTLASEQQLCSAYNWMGYLYLKGYGVKRNYTKAKEYFEKASDNEEAGGSYNLGVMYLKGIGVNRDLKLACNYFIIAANAGETKAYYQLAKMFHSGVGLQKNLLMATALYKLVAERGPWISLSRQAQESYVKGDVGKALLLYLRMAELGYEVAQSNAAWILDMYGEHTVCIGESEIWKNVERRWEDSEHGNVSQALY